MGGTLKDVGEIKENQDEEINDERIHSIHQHTLNELYKIVGGRQLTRSKLSCAPDWVLDKALREELENNWGDTHEVVDDTTIPVTTNVIASLVVYRIKTEEEGEKRMKPRLCPNGNWDKLRKTRKDSATAQFDIIRLLLSLATTFFFRLACVDIKDAYLQSGPIKRTIFVRPPRELRLPRNILWKLRKLPYVITEAGS